MKICFVLRTLDLGGVEWVTAQLANGFAERGWTVDVMCFDASGPFAHQFDQRIRIWDLGLSGNVKRRPLLFARIVLRLRRNIATTRPAVVISSKEQANLAAFIATRALPRVRTILIRHVPLDPRLAPGEAHPALKYVYRYILSRADALVGVSADISAQLAEVLRAADRYKVKAIPNPALPDEQERPVRTGDGGPILAVGRLTHQKGMDTLIEAYSRAFPGEGPQLRIVGEGPMRLSLETQIQELGLSKRVQLPGTSATVRQEMMNAAVFVLPSRWEGLPTVLLEALDCGCQVIAFDCATGPREILEGGRLGCLIPPGDVEGLSRAMIAATTSPKDWPGFNRDRYTRTGAVNMYVDLITSLCSQHLRSER